MYNNFRLYFRLLLEKRVGDIEMWLHIHKIKIHCKILLFRLF
jgi:hypothetical protein